MPPRPLRAVRVPFARDPATGGLAEENDYAAYIGQLIRQVLLTSPGERIQRPDFGAGLRRLVFAPLSDATASLARTTVVQALDRWLGAYIRTDDVRAQAAGDTLEVTVVYTVLARGTQRTLSLEVTV